MGADRPGGGSSEIVNSVNNVSRETFQLLEGFTDLLTAWNRKINLVSPSDLAQLDTRHIADSLQVYDHAPGDAANWLDLGSGAGFPALVCAILDKTTGGARQFTLIESDTRKAAFLREAARITGTKVTVIAQRIEKADRQPFDIITARALAPLPQLLAYAAPFAHENTVFLFPKGAKAESELTQTVQDWHVTSERIASRTDPSGTLLKLTKVSART